MIEEQNILTTERSIVTIVGPSLSIEQVNTMVSAMVWCLSNTPQMNVLELKSTQFKVPVTGEGELVADV